MRRTFALTMLVALGTAANLFAVGEARINGKVVDAVTKEPIAGATVLMTSVKGAGRTFKQEYKIDKDGTYAIFVLDGTIKYDIVYSAPGHTSEAFNDVKLKLGEPNKKDVELKPAAGETAKAAPAKADPAVAAYNEGAQLANAGKVDEAIAKMEEAVAVKPELIAGHEALAGLYLRKKEYPKAIASANKALEYDTDNADMAEVLYNAYTATGDTAKAAEYKKKMPANPSVLFNDAAKLINSQKDNEAEPLLKQAIAADGKFAPAYYELGMIYVRSGKNAEAKTNLQKYIELAPTGHDVATAKEMLNYIK
ncbi:MAG TPA: tetratricopeptide repeat protein [Thermoanaerobaculia bacterium]|nr:tetratricopeptide repeat protein [Thermoanaerobaculia bacterium]